MRKILSTACFFQLFLMSSLAMAQDDLSALRKERQHRPLIRANLIGALKYLDQTQVRNREGKLPCSIDWSGGDGCSPRKTKNTHGEWVSQLYIPISKIPGYNIQDSTMFITAGVVYPLFLFKDAPGKNFVKNMQVLALDNIMLYKKNESYNFWTVHPGKTSPQEVVGPLNIGFKMLDKLDRVQDFFKKLFKTLHIGDGKNSSRWDSRVGDPKQNPWGLDSYFNIPNDADDTAVAIAIQKLSQHTFGSAEASVDIEALSMVAKFRDMNRTKRDRRDNWSDINSGAYLTWLKDENLPTFGSPETGVMPIGINNVDCVVNANVLLAIGLTDQHDLAGVAEADSFLAKMIETGAWKKQCAFYYPQRMMFAYTVTRAIRDGNILAPKTSAMLPKLAKQILSFQKEDGSFDGGFDRSAVLATAQALTSLLNLGVKNMPDSRKYTSAIERGLLWLNDNSQNDGKGYVKWEAGIYFSASEWSIAQWKSEAYTTAIALEAFAKYALAYDKGDNSILNGPKINLR